MRIHILSDLHMEFGEVQIPRVDCDLVILAGDISTKWHGVQWALRQWPDVPVLYLLGNHEYYGENFPSLVEKLKALTEGSNVHVLENDAVAVGGYAFFGATLWADLALHGAWQDGAAEAGTQMNDYRRIRNSEQGYRKLEPRDTRERHLLSRQGLEIFLGRTPPEKSVIVTHHAPSLFSLPEHRRAELLSCAYTSRLEPLIQQYQPRLWIHGHIHHSQDYRIGNTRVVANPRAYPDDPNRDFALDFVVTLD